MSKKNNDIQEEKMSIYEYEQKYSKRQNVKGAKTLLFLISASIGVFLFFIVSIAISLTPKKVKPVGAESAF